MNTKQEMCALGATERIFGQAAKRVAAAYRGTAVIDTPLQEQPVLTFEE